MMPIQTLTNGGCAFAVRIRSHSTQYAIRIRNTQYASTLRRVVQMILNTQYAYAIRNTQDAMAHVVPETCNGYTKDG